MKRVARQESSDMFHKGRVETLAQMGFYFKKEVIADHIIRLRHSERREL